MNKLEFELAQYFNGIECHEEEEPNVFWLVTDLRGGGRYLTKEELEAYWEGK